MSDPENLSDADTRLTSLDDGELRALSRDGDSGSWQGERLGPYRLLKRIGEGGMAEVFLARADRKGSPLVVVKRMLPQLGGDTRFVDMFQREARVSMRLDHPNIVKVYGVVEDAGQIGLVMEYLEGLTLQDLAVRSWECGRSLPLEPVVKVLAEAARALHFAHHLPSDQGGTSCVVHRDVSPDNLLVTKQGVTKLLDFGVAKPDDELNLTRTGQVKGKVSYMAPEQARGEKLDGRSDLFSLGVSAYWLLTGVRPFDRGDPVSTMEAVILADIARPAQLNEALPRSLEIVVLRLLERDPRFRTPTGRDLAEQLEDLLVRVPRDAQNPARLLENVLDWRPNADCSWPLNAAVPSVDWQSGADASLADPWAPRPHVGDWAALETRALPVHGRSELLAFDGLSLEEPSDSGVFTDGMPAAPGGEPLAEVEPATIPMTADDTSLPSDIGADPFPLSGPITQPTVPEPDLFLDVAVPPNTDPDTLPEDAPPTLETVARTPTPTATPTPTPTSTRTLSPAPQRAVSVPTIPSGARASPRSSSRAGLIAGAAAVSLVTSAALGWFLLMRTDGSERTPPVVRAIAAPPEAPPELPPEQPTTDDDVEPVVGEPPAAVEPREQTPPTDVEPAEPRVQKRRETQPITLEGPAHVVWKLGKRTLGRGARAVEVPSATAEVRGYDRKRKVSVTVPLVDGVADWGAVLTEELVVRVRPWAKVSLGDEELGLTPLKPVAVAPGRYTLRLERDGEVREEAVRVKQGAGRVVVNVDWRDGVDDGSSPE